MISSWPLQPSLKIPTEEEENWFCIVYVYSRFFYSYCHQTMGYTMIFGAPALSLVEQYQSFAVYICHASPDYICHASPEQDFPGGWTPARKVFRFWTIILHTDTRWHEEEDLSHLEDGEEEDGLHRCHLGNSLHGLRPSYFSSNAKVSTSDLMERTDPCQSEKRNYKSMNKC